MAQSIILTLNENPQETELLDSFCRIVGTVYHTSYSKNATALLETVDFDVLVVSASLASYSSLKGLLKKNISVIITGDEEEKLKEIKREWPLSFFIDHHITPYKDQAKASFLRMLNTAAEHSQTQKKGTRN